MSPFDGTLSRPLTSAVIFSVYPARQGTSPKFNSKVKNFDRKLMENFKSFEYIVMISIEKEIA